MNESFCCNITSFIPAAMKKVFEFKRRAFVVMPFGTKEVPKRPKVDTGSAADQQDSASPQKLEVDFDAVYNKLFVPALENAGCEPFRADQETSAGDIRKDMYFELVTADLVLADISILNANVFYELGVRHAVGPRGVLALHAGWSERPFDVAPDRTFRYEGKLFVKGSVAKDSELEAEVARLTNVLTNAIAQDEQTTASPVYSLLEGLKPVDYSGIKTDRARYFGAINEDWRQKVKIARKQQNAGDILTLAEDMPTRWHRKTLLWDCSKALVALHRHGPARNILSDLLETDRDNFQAKCMMELVQNRLGFRERAEVNLSALVGERKGDGEAQGMLGRVYKDIWRSKFESVEDLQTRRNKAFANDVLLQNAIASYRAGFEADIRSFYNGINFLSLTYLYKEIGGDLEPPISEAELRDIAAAIRVACRRQLRAQSDDIWALSTLGEVELLEGDPKSAKTRYNRAARAPDTSYFEVDSMLTQLRLFQCLGFRTDAVAPIIQLLGDRAGEFGNPKGEYQKVVVSSGHMIDKADRPVPRFPAKLENAVREEIAARLEQCQIGETALALCGGACGADILFGEECIKRGAQLRLLIPLPLEEFIPASVSFAGAQWVQRLKALMENSCCKVAYQQERIGKPPAAVNPFARNNIWQINIARAQNVSPTDIFALLVWDQKPTGDGPGGTSDFANRVRSLGGIVQIINPLDLK
jgi:hypothetical protein